MCEKDQRNLDIIELLEKKQLSAIDIAKTIGCSVRTVRRAIIEVGAIIVDFMPNNRQYSPIYSLNGKELSLAEFIANAKIAQRQEKQRIEEEKEQAEASKESNITSIRRLPAEVQKRFKGGASVVCFEGRFYKRENLSC